MFLSLHLALTMDYEARLQRSEFYERTLEGRFEKSLNELRLVSFMANCGNCHLKIKDKISDSNLNATVVNTALTL